MISIRLANLTSCLFSHLSKSPAWCRSMHASAALRVLRIWSRRKDETHNRLKTRGACWNCANIQRHRNKCKYIVNCARHCLVGREWNKLAISMSLTSLLKRNVNNTRTSTLDMADRTDCNRCLNNMDSFLHYRTRRSQTTSERGSGFFHNNLHTTSTDPS